MTRPDTEIIVIPRSLELITAEDALSSLALVALVCGNRPLVSPAEVWDQLQSLFWIPADAFAVSTYSPEDFLVRFNHWEDLEGVLHGPVPVGTPFFLLWKRWRQ